MNQQLSRILDKLDEANLVDLLTGEVLTKVAEYNGQIKRGEDVISRIIYAGKNNGLQELQQMVVDTINELIERDVVESKSIRIDLNLVLAHVTADRRHFGHALDGLKRVLHKEVLL